MAESSRKGENGYSSKPAALHIDVDSMDKTRQRIDLSVESTEGGKGKDAPTIFRVPPSLRSGDNWEAYGPLMVSIGPYHNGKPHLRAMQEVKCRILDHIMNIQTLDTAEYRKMMKEMETQARHCYSEKIEPSIDFVEMMLLDGCFLIWIILGPSLKNQIPELELVANKLWFKGNLRADLLMLENQLPHCVVRRLLDALQFQEPSSQDVVLQFQESSYLEKAAGFFLGRYECLYNHDEIFHLLHLCHLVYVQKIDHHQLDYSGVMPVGCVTRCVTELKVSGVKFELKDSRNCRFWDISFKKGGVLLIPAISINDSRIFIFRNLIAFELCCPQFGGTVGSYFMFMDSIINSSKDVELLEKKGIILNGLGDPKEVASLFNGIGRSLALDTYSSDFYRSEFYRSDLVSVLQKVNKYCESRPHQWWASLFSDYLKDPWTTMKVIAAVVLLGLTVIQTIYTMLGYYHTN